jgi:hypothetical protein
VECSGFELILGIPDDRPFITVVQCSVAAFPTLGDKGNADPALPTKSTDFSNEFIPGHELQYRTYMPDNQGMCCLMSENGVNSGKKVDYRIAVRTQILLIY